MDLLREIFDWVAAETGLMRGDEWHCGHLPAEIVAPAAVLLERPGIPEHRYIQGNVGEYMFQVLAVGNTYFQARDLAHRIHAVLHDRPGVALGENQAFVIQAIAEPYVLPGDERFRFQITANYIVRSITPASWWAV